MRQNYVRKWLLVSGLLLAAGGVGAQQQGMGKSFSIEQLAVENGVVQIGTAEELAIFAQAVSEGETTVDAVLTADIDNYTGPMIGTPSVQYAGTFDGQYHKITYTSEPTSAVWGLFRTLKGGTIKNLHVAGTLNTTQKQCGGLVGFMYGGSIENTICSVDINTSFVGDAGTGGFVASVMSRGTVIKDCVFMGSINSETANCCAGIAGWTDDGASLTMTNCLSIAPILADGSGGNVLGRNPGRVDFQNCYYLYPYGDIPAGAILVDEEQLKSGEICYRLNNGLQAVQWTQTLGEENSPLPFPGGKKVYAVPDGGFLCDGTPQGNISYSNEDPGMGMPSHSFTNGICDLCGTADTDYIQTNAEGFYALASEADFLWFVTMVNSGHNDINAQLEEDIEYSGPMIGTTSLRYAGIFDGQHHKITYSTEAAEPVWALFRTLSGTVRNLHVAGTVMTAYNQSAGVAAFLYGGTIENCISSVDIISTYSGDAGYGGFTALSMENGGVIKNCLFAGTIQGENAHSCAGIAGWTSDSGSLELTNCLSIGEISASADGGNVLARNPWRVTYNNCYYVRPYADVPGGVQQITEEQVRNGAAGYMLNGNTYVKPEWFQRIGEDDYPTPNADRGIIYNVNKAYGNAFDENSLQQFKQEIESSESEYLQNITAQVTLMGEYEEALKGLLSKESVEELLKAWEEMEPLYARLEENTKAYAAYQAKVDEVIANLEKNADLQNIQRDELEYYLTKTEAPSEKYPNGTAQYILTECLIGTTEINSEIEWIDAKYLEVLSFDLVPGTDITKLFRNSDFANGWSGWNGQPGTASGESPDSKIRAAECYNSTMNISQTLTGMQNGIYEVQINGAFRPYPTSDVYSTNYAPTLFANDVHNYFMTAIEDMITKDEATDGVNCHISGDNPDLEVKDQEGKLIGYVPQGIAGCCNAFQADRYFNAVLCEVTDGTLTIGISQPGTGKQPEWLGFGNITVIYHGTKEEATDALDRVLKSMRARANTLTTTYQFSSGLDFESYPNFSQELKDQLQALIGKTAEGVQYSPENSYAIIQEFSDLFQEIYECKKAYIGMLKEAEKLAEMTETMSGILSEEQMQQIRDLGQNLETMYMNGSASIEDAKKNHLEELSLTLKEVDGAYQIGSALDLALFAVNVNAGEVDANAVLTADIADYAGPMIGTASVRYAGTFDGQYHKITYTTEPIEPVWGLFRKASGTIRNLHVAGTITTSQKQCGGLVGFLYGGTIENCISSVDINTTFAGDAGHGGFFAQSMTDGAVIKDCIYTGHISGNSSDRCAGIAGWTSDSGNLKMTNCISIGEISTNEWGCDPIARNPSRISFSNCYYLNPCGDVPAGATQVTEDAIKNGRVCYLLNAGQTNIQWTQTLDQDEYPIPFPTSKKVYATPEGGFRCDGTALGETVYSNEDPGLSLPQHNYVNGFCEICGQPDTEYIKPNADGFYQLASAGDLLWFATMINMGNNQMDAQLTADIDYAGPMIGTSSIRYAGIFDGQYHKITYTTEAEAPIWGLFRTLSGTIRNLHIAGTLKTAYNQSAGVAGFLYGGSIENCISSVDIISTFSGDAGYGGFTALSMENGGVIRDCIYIGTMQGGGAHSCAGIAGWTSDGGSLELTNCISIAEMDVDASGGNVLARNPGRVTFNNCFYLNPYADVPGGVRQVTTEQLASGEVCYLLNGNQQNIQWTQTLGEESAPKPFPGSIVLKNNDGTFYNGEDAVEKVQDSESMVQSDVFDLSGRKIDVNSMKARKLSRGLYIINGKKVLVK